MILGIVWNVVALVSVVYFAGRYAKDPEFQSCRMPIYEQVNIAARNWAKDNPKERVPSDILQNGHTEHQCRLCGRSKFRHIFYNV